MENFKCLFLLLVGKSIFPSNPAFHISFLSNKLLENWRYQKIVRILGNNISHFVNTNTILEFDRYLSDMSKRRETATENVEAVVGRRLCKKTKANNDSKIKLFTDWMRRHESNEVVALWILRKTC